MFSININNGKKFFTIFATFLVLGASFKVMTLVEGLTEVRPVNAIPPVAGLVCGPIGALACAIGNLGADLFGTFDLSSILGFIGNFVAAYLPYRLWHLVSEESPNLHSHKNILRYILICTVSACTTAWILSFGLYTFFGFWIEVIYIYVFWNNLGFSICLGMPILIVLTSDYIQMPAIKPLPYLILGRIKKKAQVLTAYALMMTVILVSVALLHLSPQDASWLQIISALSLAGLVIQLV